MEALVAFPGLLKSFYAGRGSWADTGLWVSARGEYELEMRSTAGYLRKRLSQHDGEQWLEANGHPPAMSYLHGATPSRKDGERTWSVVTKTDAVETARKTAERVKREQRIRSAIAKAPTAPPPTIRPPRKTRSPRRGK
jgi:hypothetical protein